MFENLKKKKRIGNETYRGLLLSSYLHSFLRGLKPNRGVIRLIK